MNRVNLRWMIACALMTLCAAVSFAEPLPMPEADPRYPAGNLLTNANFENDLSGWTVTKNNGKVKLRCGLAGYGSNCGVLFQGKTADHHASITQTFKMPSNSSKLSILVDGSFAQRSLSGTSCLKVTIKVKFRSAATAPMKRTTTTCGTGAAQDWSLETDGLYVNQSFAEKSLKKITVTVTHTGIGEWYFDKPVMKFVEK